MRPLQTHRGIGDDAHRKAPLFAASAHVPQSAAGPFDSRQRGADEAPLALTATQFDASDIATSLRDASAAASGIVDVARRNATLYATSATATTPDPQSATGPLDSRQRGAVATHLALTAAQLGASDAATTL